MTRVRIDTGSAEGYRLFLAVKSLPRYRFAGHVGDVPDEYAARLGVGDVAARRGPKQTPSPCLYDYQRDVAALAFRKKKFAFFAACGRGKTPVMLDVGRMIRNTLPKRRLLIVSPPNVIRQTIGESFKFFGDTLGLERVRAADLQSWMDAGGGAFGITNYEAIREGLRPGRLCGLILDESSTMKSHYGAWGTRLIALGRGLPYKLCLTGTPAPNDRIEFANHAVFLDRFPNVNSFLAKFFVNRGKTDARWELKAHALRPFYRALSDWCVFLDDPATYGWKDGCDPIPPIRVHVHDVPMTDEQKALVSSVSGDMYGSPGGITSRSKLSQLAKGSKDGADVPTNKPAYIRDLVRSWPGESTIIWCQYNREQNGMEAQFPGAASIRGTTPEADREALIDEFKAGSKTEMISKGKVLGFGLNLQVATRQVFSGLQDSYETYWQCVKRSNRIGSARPLDVHIPVTEIERAMIETVLRKAARVEADTREQEALFKESACLTF